MFKTKADLRKFKDCEMFLTDKAKADELMEMVNKVEESVMITDYKHKTIVFYFGNECRTVYTTADTYLYWFDYICKKYEYMSNVAVALRGFMVYGTIDAVKEYCLLLIRK